VPKGRPLNATCERPSCTLVGHGRFRCARLVPDPGRVFPAPLISVSVRVSFGVPPSPFSLAFQANPPRNNLRALVLYSTPLGVLVLTCECRIPRTCYSREWTTPSRGYGDPPKRKTENKHSSRLAPSASCSACSGVMVRGAPTTTHVYGGDRHTQNGPGHPELYSALGTLPCYLTVAMARILRGTATLPLSLMTDCLRGLCTSTSIVHSPLSRTNCGERFSLPKLALTSPILTLENRR
jgi:hypothetical protein